MKKQFTLIEYSYLYISEKNGETDGSNIGLTKKTFEEVELFVLENDSAGQFLTITSKRGIGKIARAKQYVGVIETKSGILIEILPKIAQLEDHICTRKTFMKMLKQLRHSPFKHFDTANLSIQKMHLLEIFIAMFCEELANLIRRGIKSDYISKEENSKFLKGRLKLSDHIRKNMVHKERFYVEFDEYLQNRIENRIIKTTLQFLYKKTKSSTNKKRLREFLFVFDGITPVHDIKSAFKKVRIDRQMKDYGQIIHWCRLFLNNESFTSFKGNSVAFALLFDMNRVFEDYVAHCMRRDDSIKDLRTQVSEESLLINPKKFRLKPDLKYHQEGKSIIGDTKWKLLTSEKGMSQSDIYQMFAYGKKYSGVKEIHLIYPWNDRFPQKREYEFDDECDNKLKLIIKGFDCESGRFI